MACRHGLRNARRPPAHVEPLHPLQPPRMVFLFLTHHLCVALPCHARWHSSSRFAAPLPLFLWQHHLAPARGPDACGAGFCNCLRTRVGACTLLRFPPCLQSGPAAGLPRARPGINLPLSAPLSQHSPFPVRPLPARVGAPCLPLTRPCPLRQPLGVSAQLEVGPACLPPCPHHVAARPWPYATLSSAPSACTKLWGARPPLLLPTVTHPHSP
jgi:hypothetical protein